MTTLVVGAAGTIGSLVTHALARDGQPVRALVRTPQRASGLPERAEVVAADLDDPQAVRAAVDGVDSVVLIAANGPAQAQHEIHVIDAAAGAGVAHLVKLSVGGAAPDAPLAMARAHAEAEGRLRDSGVAATVVRPGFFMQNLVQYAAWIEPDGTWTLPLGLAGIAMVDGRDVADVVAAVVVGPARGELTPLSGSQALTMPDAVALLAAAAGRDLTYVDGTAEAFLSRLLSEGYAEAYARDLTALYDQVIRPGYAGVVTDGVRQVLGREPRSFADFARDHAEAFTR